MIASSRPPLAPSEVAVCLFPTTLGWSAVTFQGSRLTNVVFGHPDQDTVMAVLRSDRLVGLGGRWMGHSDDACQRLVARIQAYCYGKADDFLDVEIDEDQATDFQRRVRAACRHIPRGQTLTYSKLAAIAGSPGAARAVGQVMATNRTPLVMPCHRVVGASGGWGGFSAPGGISTKRRLLELEGHK